MVKAMATLPDGRALIVMGISAGNVDRLKAGQPIYFDSSQLHIKPGTGLGVITLFYGENDAELARVLKTLIGPQTDVVVVPHGDGKPQ